MPVIVALRPLCVCVWTDPHTCAHAPLNFFAVTKDP